MRPVLLCLLLAWSADGLRLPSTGSRRGVDRRSLLCGSTAAATLAVAPRSASADQVVSKFVTTPGGVKYFDVKEGSCALFNVACSPQEGDLVKIAYKAYLSNGKQFDSSDGPGRKPLAVKFKSGKLLPGWEEGMEGMKEGGVRVMQVPSSLAYGEKGIKVETKDGTEEYLVPPNEKLQFELTLLQVAVPPP